jgi:hypothetical protein
VPSPYAEAIDLMRTTIVARARLYKHLVMLVSALLVGAAIAAFARHSAQPLLVLCVMPCVVVSHAALDLALVHRWHREAHARWAAGSIELPLLIKTVQQVPGLPEGTVLGMLETLATWQDVQVATEGRAALATAAAELARVDQQRLAARAVAWGCVAAGVLLAAWTPLGLPGLALAAAPWPVLVLLRLRHPRRPRALSRAP